MFFTFFGARNQIQIVLHNTRQKRSAPEDSSKFRWHTSVVMRLVEWIRCNDTGKISSRQRLPLNIQDAERLAQTLTRSKLCAGRILAIHFDD